MTAPNVPASARVRALTTVTTLEETLVAHVRGWCHDSHGCTLCQQTFRILELEREVRLLDGRLDSIIGG